MVPAVPTLRHYVRSDLLAENPLMRSRLLAKDAPGAPEPLALKTLLAETAEGLFDNARGVIASSI